MCVLAGETGFGLVLLVLGLYRMMKKGKEEKKETVETANTHKD